MLSFWGAEASPTESPDHQTPTFCLSMRLSVLSSFPGHLVWSSPQRWSEDSGVNTLSCSGGAGDGNRLPTPGKHCAAEPHQVQSTTPDVFQNKEANEKWKPCWNARIGRSREAPFSSGGSCPGLNSSSLSGHTPFNSSLLPFAHQQKSSLTS